MDQNQALREHLRRLLDWEDTHVSFDSAVKDVLPDIRGKQPEGYPHSLWQLVEHIRICQRDILDFSLDPSYRELKWEEYWPANVAPANEEAWEKSLAAFRADLERVKELAMDPSIDLFAVIPHGTGQTYLRELLLVADHNAYHIGQLVAVRRLLDNWKQ